MLKKIKHTIQGLLSATSAMSVRVQVGLAAKYVGTDELGNRYFVGKPRTGTKRDRRFVLYANMAGDHGYDASQIPPEWHGWMHHQTNDLPQAQNPLRHSWQLPPQQNLTGTAGAYFPPGHALGGGKRDKATGDYDAWTPPV
ncbi:MAG TPA: NADH-ubiquinone oxidoreductase subunit NDUFA12 family protein [Alphaproteobacteria bacterium]